ncbi:unnamed protein product [Gulo gulo]|uniref:Uncharacterized protein n=1 Tax=Gulo gulo TaxID=48420 RepID=A0A9X9LLE0_GULGU|nr:unnamed protein product [Gulo gulo]
MLPVITASGIISFLPWCYSPEQKPTLGWVGTVRRAVGSAPSGSSNCVLLWVCSSGQELLWGRACRAQGSRDFVL